jgi:hypothetical protein
MPFNIGDYFLFCGYSIGENRKYFDKKLVRVIGTNNTDPVTTSLLVIENDEEIDVAYCSGIDVLVTEEHFSLFGFKKNIIKDSNSECYLGEYSLNSVVIDNKFTYVNTLLQHEILKKINQKEIDKIILQGLN